MSAFDVRLCQHPEFLSQVRLSVACSSLDALFLVSDGTGKRTSAIDCFTLLVQKWECLLEMDGQSVAALTDMSHSLHLIGKCSWSTSEHRPTEASDNCLTHYSSTTGRGTREVQCYDRYPRWCTRTARTVMDRQCTSLTCIFKGRWRRSFRSSGRSSINWRWFHCDHRFNRRADLFPVQSTTQSSIRHSLQLNFFTILFR